MSLFVLSLATQMIVVGLFKSFAGIYGLDLDSLALPRKARGLSNKGLLP